MHLELNAEFSFGIITITMNATVRDYFCWFANLINCFVMSAEVGRGKGKVKRVDILVDIKSINSRGAITAMQYWEQCLNGSPL